MRALIHTIRLRHGLRWRGVWPSLQEAGITAGNTLVALCVVLVFGLIEGHEARVEQQIAAQRHAEAAQRNEAALLACMNGGAPGFYTTDERGVRHYIVCGDTWTVSDENIKEKRG